MAGRPAFMLPAMATLEIANLTKHYGNVIAVDDFSLAVEPGEFVSLLGPSGCGKTTILRMIAGLIEPDAGSISIAGTDVSLLPPHKRNIGLVFQSYALFPHMSVFENVAFGLRQRRVVDPELSERVMEALDLVRLSGLERRMPRELSGGQQQRVALARAIAPRPSLLLLDEPLSNLDAKLRDTMRIELRLLQGELSITTVFVTHDQEEALTMSDRICVLHQGRLQQVDAPRAIYDHPRTPFVAEFFGRSNTFEGRIVSQDGEARVALAGGFEIAVSYLPDGLAPGDPVQVTIRRENLTVSPGDRADAPNSFVGTVELASFAGNSTLLVVRSESGVELMAEIRTGRGREAPEPGSRVTVSFDPADVIVVGA